MPGKIRYNTVSIFIQLLFSQPGVDYIPLLFIQHVKLESAAALGI